MTVIRFTLHTELTYFFKLRSQLIDGTTHHRQPKQSLQKDNLFKYPK